MPQVVLVHPDIPHNTGAIARTCAMTATPLILVNPLGFSLSSRHLKRAGLDYWSFLDLRCVDSLEEVLDLKTPFYFFSSKATSSYSSIQYEKNALLIFGSETKGLPPLYWEKWSERFYTIPTKKDCGRCLNLANAASIVLYEAWRQNQFSF